MNKKLLMVLAAAGVITLAGCQNSTTAPEVRYIDRAFTGVLPCADCSGIETTILFNQDGSYVEELTYLGTRDGDQTMFETGSWAKDGDKLRLTNTQGERSYFAPSADDKSVTMLDSDGNAVESQFDYTLKQVTPSKKIGEYHYMADAATFIECGTKRNYAASGIELERNYGATGVNGGTPVYAEIEGYYTIRPSMEDGLFNPALVQTGSILFNKEKSCPTK